MSSQRKQQKKDLKAALDAAIWILTREGIITDTQLPEVIALEWISEKDGIAKVVIHVTGIDETYSIIVNVSRCPVKIESLHRLPRPCPPCPPAPPCPACPAPVTNIVVKCGGKKQCCDDDESDQFKARVLYIDEVSGQLKATQVTIELAVAKGLWPNVVEAGFDYITDFDETNLDQVLLEIEADVTAGVAEGFNYVVFGGRSTFIGPWIRGDGVLGGLNANQRFPTIIFIETNLGTHAAQLIPLVNFWKIFDTHAYPDLVTTNIQTFLKPGGQLLAVYEFPDTASEQAVADYKVAATALGIPLLEAKLTFDSSTHLFTPGSVSAANAAIAALPSGSVVLLAVNGDPVHADALSKQIDWSLFGATTTALGINYTPANVTVPIVIQAGFTSFSLLYLAPVFYKELNFSPLPVPEPRNSFFVEALAFASDNVVGKLYRGTNGLSRFDAFRELYWPYIADSFTPANTFETKTSDVRENPKWTAASVLNGPQLDVQPPFA